MENKNRVPPELSATTFSEKTYQLYLPGVVMKTSHFTTCQNKSFSNLKLEAIELKYELKLEIGRPVDSRCE